MITNESLQQDVEDAIAWEPSLHAAEIGVSVKDGVVTLSGIVDSYHKKLEAEHAAKNVAGVKAIIEKIQIVVPNSQNRNDEELAADVLRALADDWIVPHEKIKVKVEKGWVYLEGTVPWDYQRKAAKSALKGIRGIIGVINNIQIKAEVHDALEKSLIEKALRRNWSIDADQIKVKVEGKTVTLSGAVSSIYQKEEAERIAWKTPGIWSVHSELVVDH